MDKQQERTYHLAYVNQFRSLTRESFQEWFVGIMEAAFPGDFSGTRQGTHQGGGDLGCDGYRASTSTVFAVYAPRNCSLSELNAKLVRDLNSAIAHFGPRMHEWVFVHNDSQLSAETTLLLAQLNAEHQDLRIGQFMKEAELWDIVRGLPVHRLEKLFPDIPVTTPLEDESTFLDRMIRRLRADRGVSHFSMLETEQDVTTIPFDECGFHLLDCQSSDLLPNHPPISVAQAVEANPSFMLIGAPGSGKTTIMRYIAHEAAVHRQTNSLQPIPLLIDAASWQPTESVLALVARYWTLGGNLRELLANGQIWLFLDGLNEVGAIRIELVRALREWMESPSRPLRIMISCREADFASQFSISRDLPTLKLRPISKEQIPVFVEKYLRDQAPLFLDQVSFVDKNHIDPNRTLSKLIFNPFFLSALIYIFASDGKQALPRNCGGLVQRLIRALWQREQTRRTVGWKPLDEVEVLLANLAFEMIDRGTSATVPVSFALQHVKNYDNLRVAANANILVIDDRCCRFYHQLIQEYFAALRLREIGIAGRLTAPDFGGLRRLESRWDQVIIALAGIVPESGSLLNEVCRIDPYLAAACIGSGVSSSGDIEELVVSRLLDALETGSYSERWEAAAALGGFQRESAISGLVKAIYDHSRDPMGMIGGLCASALAAIGPITIPYLIPALNFSWTRPSIQSALLWMGNASIAPLSEFLKSGANWSSILSATDVLVAKNTKETWAIVEEWLITSGLSHPLPYVRRHSAFVAGHISSHRCRPLLVNLIYDLTVVDGSHSASSTVSSAAVAALKAIDSNADGSSFEPTD